MSNEKSKIFVSCGEANHYCDKNQYREASLWEKIKLNIHLIYCRACRKYSAKNNRLSDLMKNPKVYTLDQSTKNDLKEQLKQKLAEKG